MATRSAIVLGAGMVGVATALHLQRRGWSAALIDRNEVGLETSYGNAGVIQSEAVRPYAMPRDLRSLAAIARRRTNDVHYSLASLPRHLGPLVRYWWHSAPRRHERISDIYARIIGRAADEHDGLIRAAGADVLVRRDGYRVLHRRQIMMNEAIAEAEALHASYGTNYRVLGPAELAQAEPSLGETGVGAIHWLDPWTVSDPGGLVTAYAELFSRSGGAIIRGDAATLAPLSGGGWTVETAEGRIEAETAVIALGPWSADILRGFGYHIPMVRKRGYHRHFAGGSQLDLPIRDADFGYVLAPMKTGLRITTGAELSAPDAPPTPIQLGRAESAARQLIDLGDPVEREPWLGTRPCTPDMLPVIGQAPKHRGLWMNFGHGHQGFTLGPATGRMLAEVMSGEEPLLDAIPFKPDRYCA